MRKGGEIVPQHRDTSLFCQIFFSFSFASERTDFEEKPNNNDASTRHSVDIYIHSCICSREWRTRSKSEQFEESIPTGFIPTDRFLEFCDSSFFEDDPSECLACPSHLDPSPPPFPFGSSRDFRPQRIGVDFTRYRTRLDACDVPLNRGGRRLRKS